MSISNKRWTVFTGITYAPNIETCASAPAALGKTVPGKPKLYRHQLTEHFRQNGLPALSLNYLNKIASRGEGPPVAMTWNRRPLYDPDEAVAWLRAKVEEQTAAARERAEQNRQFRQRQIERLKKQVIAAREAVAA
ncbi:hypothetical protein [Bradyrhizobium sp. STM 3562]|uniref:hypothetical protein n=1 Tax=Bradyrhizobium sp. STM 3562 TaxID=578924 RepID=UPI00388E023A